MQQKKAQLTTFIIIAIVVIAAALFSYFVIFRAPSALPAKLQPVEAYYLDCVSEKTQDALRLAGMQGGYLEMPEFEAGSEYKQFSNYYMFLGSAIPYWYYVSGSNIQKEQVPSKEEIENQISKYLKEEVEKCTLESFVSQGYVIEMSPVVGVSTTIKDSSVDVTVNQQIKIEFGDIKATVSNHKATVKSSLGGLYKEAVEIYNYEKETAFLENYTIDTLYLNAPVTGIEIQCAPEVWLKSEVKNDLKEAIAANIGQIKIKGDYYRLASSLHNYFIVDTGKNMGDNVNFLATEPYRIEIWPSEDGTLRADPVGTQPGLSIMGFCYVPYHFVYDIDFPVLVQLSRGDEIFQFPFAVVIDKTVPRKAELGETDEIDVEICDYKGAVGTVYTYDQNNNALESKVSYKCINQVCPIGMTTVSGNDAVLVGKFPQCLNGFVIAEAPGYAKAKVQVSTNKPFSTSVYLQQVKRFNVNINLASNEEAIVMFSSPEHSTTLFYPTQKQVELTSTVYEVTAQVFKDKTISLGSGTSERCVSVPDWLGIMHEQCYEFELPQQTLTSVMFGGGSATFAPSASEIASSSRVNIHIPTVDVPSNLQELQDVYSTIAISELQLSLS
jgi:hypothetical protein